MSIRLHTAALRRDEEREQKVSEPRLAPYYRSKTPRVLLIEDDRTTRRLVSAALGQYCNLLEAPDASQGISAYNVSKPDLVLMDIELPDGDGNDLLEWMLNNDPGAFVVMFSGHSHTDNVMKSMENGAKGFISKPFDVNKMLYFLRMCPKLH